MWDLGNGECLLKTLQNHSNSVCCLVLLKNGQLASGKTIMVKPSRDKTIKIRNIDSGECVKSLQGHSFIIGGVC